MDYMDIRVDFISENMIGDDFIMTKMSIRQEEITILYIYAAD